MNQPTDIIDGLDGLIEATRYAKETGKRFAPEFDRLAELVKEPFTLVHFSELRKLGNNPRSSFWTPMGIYGYPVNKTIYRQLKTDKIPFASDRDWMHIFKVKKDARSKVITSGRGPYNNPYTERDLEGDKSKLMKVAERLDAPVWDVAPEFRYAPEHKVWEEAFIVWEDEANIESPIGYLWNITRNIAKRMPGKTTINWAKLFRKVLDIKGVIDWGTELIHEHEPTQGVIFEGRDIEKIGTIKTSKMARTRRLDKTDRADEVLSDLESSAETIAKGVSLRDDPHDIAEAMRKLVQLRDDFRIEYSDLSDRPDEYNPFSGADEILDDKFSAMADAWLGAHKLRADRFERMIKDALESGKMKIKLGQFDSAEQEMNGAFVATSAYEPPRRDVYLVSSVAGKAGKQSQKVQSAYSNIPELRVELSDTLTAASSMKKLDTINGNIKTAYRAVQRLMQDDDFKALMAGDYGSVDYGSLLDEEAVQDILYALEAISLQFRVKTPRGVSDEMKRLELKVKRTGLDYKVPTYEDHIGPLQNIAAMLGAFKELYSTGNLPDSSAEAFSSVIKSSMAELKSAEDLKP